MTPAEQEIAFFKEAKRIQEGWEPKFGDWAIDIHSEDVVLIIDCHGPYIDFVPLSWEGYEKGSIHGGLKEYFVFLPRQGQLQEMLEERGYEHGLMWEFWGPRRFEPEKRYKLEVSSRLGKMEFFAPTASIALGRALIEVLGDV